MRDWSPNPMMKGGRVGSWAMSQWHFLEIYWMTCIFFGSLWAVDETSTNVFCDLMGLYHWVIQSASQTWKKIKTNSHLFVVLQYQKMYWGPQISNIFFYFLLFFRIFCTAILKNVLGAPNFKYFFFIFFIFYYFFVFLYCNTKKCIGGPKFQIFYFIFFYLLLFFFIFF